MKGALGGWRVSSTIKEIKDRLRELGVSETVEQTNTERIWKHGACGDEPVSPGAARLSIFLMPEHPATFRRNITTTARYIHAAPMRMKTPLPAENAITPTPLLEASSKAKTGSCEDMPGKGWMAPDPTA